MANSSSRYLPSRNTPYDFEKSPRNISQLTNRPDLRRIGKLAGRRRRVVASKEIMVPIVCRRHALKVAPLNPKPQTPNPKRQTPKEFEAKPVHVASKVSNILREVLTLQCS
jgi:hypothetical protein